MQQLVAALLHDLMHVRGVREGPQGGCRGRSLIEGTWKVDAERRAELHSADRNSRVTKTRQRCCGVLELDGEMAAIEAERNVIAEKLARRINRFTQRRGKSRGTVHEHSLLEERDGLVGVLQRAIRLGFDVEVDVRSVFPPDAY